MKRLILQMHVQWLVDIAHCVYSLLLLRLAVQILSCITCSLVSSSIRFPNFLNVCNFETVATRQTQEGVILNWYCPSAVSFTICWKACCAAIWAQKDDGEKVQGHVPTHWGARYITPSSQKFCTKLLWQHVWQCTDTANDPGLEISVHKASKHSKHRKNF